MGRWGTATRRNAAQWIALVLAALAAAVGGIPGASASPLEMFGFGPRSSGMAGTGVATADDFESAYLNPAGLASVSGRRLTVGGVYGAFGLELDGESTDTAPARGLMWGGAFRLPLGGALRDRVGVAIGLYVPSEALVRVDVPNTGEPVFALLETRSHVVGLMAALGVRVTDRVSVGLGILSLAALQGGIFIDADAGGNFRSLSEQELTTSMAPILGVTYRPGPTFELGAVFRGESRSDYSIEVTNDLADDLPLTLPTLTVAGNAQFDPLTLAIEAGWQASGNGDTGFRVLGQLAYQHWSAFPSPTKSPTEMGVPPEAPGFHDTVVPRLGVEGRLDAGALGRLSLRGGYAFVWSPAPEMDSRPSLLDNHRHVVATGIGIAWQDGAVPLRVDLWMQAHLLAPRRHTKDLDRYESGERVPFATIRATGQVLVGGVSVGVDL